MRALWGGERVFRGGHWSFEEATFAPLPEPQPELWVGGGGHLSNGLELLVHCSPESRQGLKTLLH